MPASYDIDLRAGVVFTVFEGHVTNEELLEYQQRLSADPDFRPTMNNVIDTRGVTDLSVTALGVRVVATTSIFAPGSRRAIIASGTSPAYRYGEATSECSRPYAIRAAKISSSSRRSRTCTAGSG